MQETTQDMLNVLERMIALSRRFEIAAVESARTVVSELYLNETRRSIKRVTPAIPVYLSNNIVIEVVTAPGAEAELGPLEVAAKSANLGVRGLQTVLSNLHSNPDVVGSDSSLAAMLNQLQLGFRVVVDYLGHRVRRHSF